MATPRHLINKYQKLCKQKFGLDITATEAEQELLSLINIIRTKAKQGGKYGY